MYENFKVTCVCECVCESVNYIASNRDRHTAQLITAGQDRLWERGSTSLKLLCVLATFIGCHSSFGPVNVRSLYQYFKLNLKADLLFLMHRFSKLNLILCKGPGASGWLWILVKQVSQPFCVCRSGRKIMTAWAWTTSRSPHRHGGNAGRRSWQPEQVEGILSAKTP